MGQHHSHDHHHGPVTVAGKAFVWGIVLNGIYVVAQLAAGILTNSVALITDAVHNLGDVATLILSLTALKLARVKPTDNYTYGYKKSTILAALINAVILLIAIGTLGYESITRLWHPEPMQGGTVAWVAGIGIVINTVSAFLFFRDKEHELNAKSAYLHLLSDAAVSLGVVITGIIVSYTGWYLLDPIASIVILIVILYSTWSLLTDSLRLSLDGVPRDVDINEVEHIIKNVKGVCDLHHTHIWAMSTTENALTTHVILNEQLNFEEKMKVVLEIKHCLQHKGIQHATVEIESPDMPCAEENC
ncbi:MAG: cation transporter [Bacteroidetes bacterium 46-16]|nr:MAG: cation transporter [Bacteroidetes bacterium 46-16]